MLQSIAALKQALRTQKPVPIEFAGLLPRHSPHEKLDSIYKSPKLHQKLHLRSVQELVWGTLPPGPPELLMHSPGSVYMAIRLYLYSKDLKSAFAALEYLPKQPWGLPKQLWGLGPLALGLGSGLVWQGPVGILLGGFWSGLGIVPQTSPQYRFVQWRPQVPKRRRNPEKIALCDHIVAWYEDHIGTTTENWHRRADTSPDQEQALAALLASHDLERAPRGVDLEYADYWGHRDDFTWQEPDQDPAFMSGRTHSHTTHSRTHATHH